MEKSGRTKTRKRKKLLFIEKFGGKCCICGYDKCENSLHFHHTDSSKKEHTPAELFCYSNSIIEKELENCILVCANCHGEIHHEKYNSTINCRILVKKWIVKSCKFCNEEFKTKNEFQKFCSPNCSSLDQRRIKNRPTSEELKNMIQKYSWVSLGKKFGVSDNAVRKWAKAYQLI